MAGVYLSTESGLFILVGRVSLPFIGFEKSVKLRASVSSESYIPALRGEGVETIDKEGECRGESSGELVSELDPDPELVSSETSLPRLPPSSAACPEWSEVSVGKEGGNEKVY